MALVISSCMGIEVYKDITSRLHGCGSILLVVKSPAYMHLMRSRLFSRCGGTSLSIGLRALASSHVWSIGVRYNWVVF